MVKTGYDYMTNIIIEDGQCSNIDGICILEEMLAATINGSAILDS